VLQAGTPVYEYAPHTWGPSEVEQRVVSARGWHHPIVTG
jgi:glucose-6-phosphate 1-dehydrogenase